MDLGGAKQILTPLEGGPKNFTPFQQKSPRVTIVQRGGGAKKISTPLEGGA